MFWKHSVECVGVEPTITTLPRRVTAPLDRHSL